MEAVTILLKQDISSSVVTLFVLLSAVIAMYEIIGKFSKMIGRPVKWVRRKEDDHNLIIRTIKELNQLQKAHDDSVKQSKIHDNAIRNDLRNLTSIFIDKSINDYRWEIINFSNRIANGESCSQDGYRHCLSTYERYEKLLEENDMENGEVEISMDIINDSYRQKLKDGF